MARIKYYDANSGCWEYADEFGTAGLTPYGIGAIPAPTNANVGQTIVVKAVDDNNKPTQWEAADLSSGGGGMEKLVDFTTTETTREFQIPIDTQEMVNKLLNASEFHIYLYVPRDAEDTETNTSGNVSIGALSTTGNRPVFATFDGVIITPSHTGSPWSKSIAKIFIDTFDNSLEQPSIGLRYKRIANGTRSSELYHMTVDRRVFKLNSNFFVTGTQNMAAGTRFVLGVRA